MGIKLYLGLALVLGSAYLTYHISELQADNKLLTATNSIQKQAIGEMEIAAKVFEADVKFKQVQLANKRKEVKKLAAKITTLTTNLYLEVAHNEKLVECFNTTVPDTTISSLRSSSTGTFDSSISSQDLP